MTKTLNQLVFNFSNQAHHFRNNNKHCTFHELNVKHDVNHEVIEPCPVRVVVGVDTLNDFKLISHRAVMKR